MAQKHFVLDTNVLIENPKCITALRNGQENQIYIPYTVTDKMGNRKWMHQRDAVRTHPGLREELSAGTRIGAAATDGETREGLGDPSH